MKKSLFLLATASTLVFSGSAFAASLTNYDESTQVVIISEAGNETSVTLEGNQSVEDICAKGCTLKFGNGEEYNLAGNEIVAIEGNQVYIDQMDAVSNDPEGEEPTETEETGEPAPEEEAAPEEPQE